MKLIAEYDVDPAAFAKFILESGATLSTQTSPSAPTAAQTSVSAVPVIQATAAPAVASASSAGGPVASVTSPPSNDPWAGIATQQNAAQAPANPTSGVAPSVTPGGTPTGAPTCPHGNRIFRPAGVSKNNRPYPAFWGCPAEANDPNKCKGVPA
jgi:hypothetical protein